MHVHTYRLSQTKENAWRLEFEAQFSTDAVGIARSLGLQADPNVALETITAVLETRISPQTLFTLH